MLSKAINQLENHNVVYRLVRHAPEGRCMEVSALRGNAVHQAAKALVFQNKKATAYVLAILGGDSAADSGKLGAALGLGRLSFAPPEKVLELTECQVGTVGMFSFHPDLHLVLDKAFFEANKGGEIVGAFGSLEQSIFIPLEDYLRVARPQIIAFSKSAA